MLLSRIVILLLKGYFGREKINFHEKNLKYRKVILLINFIFAPTFFLIRNGEVVGNLFSEKMIHDLLESHNFLKFGKKR